MTNRYWTGTEDRKLRRYREVGFSFSKIAGLLGRHKGCCQRRYHRLMNPTTKVEKKKRRLDVFGHSISHKDPSAQLLALLEKHHGEQARQNEGRWDTGDMTYE